MDVVLTEEDVYKRLLKGDTIIINPLSKSSVSIRVKKTLVKKVKKKPKPKVDIEELRKSLKSLSKTVRIKQDEKAVITHHGISHNRHVSLSERYGHILISFEDLYGCQEWQAGNTRGWKTRRKLLIAMTETIFKAKCVESWDHSQRGVSIRINKKIPKSFFKCITNYRDFECPKCTGGVFCKCGVLTKRFNLFKYEKGANK